MTILRQIFGSIKMYFADPDRLILKFYIGNDEPKYTI